MSKFAFVDGQGNPVYTAEAEGYVDGDVYGGLTARTIPQDAVDHDVITTWYWKGLWKTRTPRPDFIQTWNNTTEQWEDQRTLAELKTAIVDQLQVKRETLLQGGFTWDGSVFDSDAAISQPRLLGAFTTSIAGGWPAGGQGWRLKNNTWRVLSATDVQGVWAAFQTHMTGLFGTFATKEAAVLAETDINVLRTYDVNAGW